MLSATLFILQVASAQAITAQPSIAIDACRAIVSGDEGAREICLAQGYRAAANSVGSTEYGRAQLREAAIHFVNAARMSSEPQLKRRLLKSLLEVYDREKLDELGRMEQVARELLTLEPDDLSPLLRVAVAREREGLTDAAEDLLLDLRRTRPEALEPVQRLAQFYARLAGNKFKEIVPPVASLTALIDQPDESGVYQLGAAKSIVPPTRLADGALSSSVRELKWRVP